MQEEGPRCKRRDLPKDKMGPIKGKYMAYEKPRPHVSQSTPRMSLPG